VGSNLTSLIAAVFAGACAVLGAFIQSAETADATAKKTGVWHKRVYTVIVEIRLFPMHPSVTIVGVLIGVMILFFGRKLFWLCVAAVGFAVGVQIAPLLVNEPSSLLALLIALAFGVLGALLAVFLQKIAIAVLGFLAGGKLATAIAAAFFVHHAQYSTIIFVVGGIIGAILLVVVFGWALIVVSSFIGAYLIQSAIVLPPTGSTLVFIGLAIVGMFVQAASFRRSAI
jgi:hypothetical protein